MHANILFEIFCHIKTCSLQLQFDSNKWTKNNLYTSGFGLPYRKVLNELQWLIWLFVKHHTQHLKLLTHVCVKKKRVYNLHADPETPISSRDESCKYFFFINIIAVWITITTCHWLCSNWHHVVPSQLPVLMNFVSVWNDGWFGGWHADRIRVMLFLFLEEKWLYVQERKKGKLISFLG